VFYLIYLVEAVACRATVYLKGMREAEKGFRESLSKMSEGPRFTFFLQNYHYETREHTDSNGNRHSEQVVVVTNTAHGSWNYSEFWDVNDPYPVYFGMARVRFTNEYSFFDDATRNDHSRSFEEFIRLNDNHDAHRTTSSKVIVPKCANHVGFDAGLAPYFLRYTYYVYATLVLCSLPFRMWLVSTTSKNVTRMKKVVWKKIA